MEYGMDVHTQCRIAQILMSPIPHGHSPIGFLTLTRQNEVEVFCVVTLPDDRSFWWNPVGHTSVKIDMQETKYSSRPFHKHASP